MPERKPRSEMSEYEKAVDWEQRLSPRWWKVIFAMFGLAGVLFLVGGIIRLASI